MTPTMLVGLAALQGWLGGKASQQMGVSVTAEGNRVFGGVAHHSLYWSFHFASQPSGTLGGGGPAGASKPSMAMRKSCGVVEGLGYLGV